MLWSIVEVNGEDQTFLTLIEKLQSGCCGEGKCWNICHNTGRK